MTKHSKLFLQVRNEHYKRNIKLIKSRLYNILLALLACGIYLGALYILLLWRF